MSVEIREVTSKKELKKFVKFNIELYKGNPYHVPGLIEEEMMTLDKKKNTGVRGVRRYLLPCL